MDANYKVLIVFSGFNAPEEFRFFGSYREEKDWLVFYQVEGVKKKFNKTFKIEHILSYTIELLPELEDSKVEDQNGTNLAKG